MHVETRQDICRQTGREESGREFESTNVCACEGAVFCHMHAVLCHQGNYMGYSCTELTNY